MEPTKCITSCKTFPTPHASSTTCASPPRVLSRHVSFIAPCPSLQCILSHHFALTRQVLCLTTCLSLPRVSPTACPPRHVSTPPRVHPTTSSTQHVPYPARVLVTTCPPQKVCPLPMQNRRYLPNNRPPPLLHSPSLPRKGPKSGAMTMMTKFPMAGNSKPPLRGPTYLMTYWRLSSRRTK